MKPESSTMGAARIPPVSSTSAMDVCRLAPTSAMINRDCSLPISTQAAAAPTASLSSLGLRAFPPEVRLNILKYNYLGAQFRYAYECPLLQAYQNHGDVVIYKEVIVEMHRWATFVTFGQWTVFDEEPQCQWMIRSGEVEDDKKDLVKALRINHIWAVPLRFSCELKLSKEDLNMGKYFDGFTGVQDLSLDLWQFLSPASNLPTPDYVACTVFRLIWPLVAKFSQLRKLSVILLDHNAKKYVGRDAGWEFIQLDPIITDFEDYAWEIITAAFGVLPKLDSVRDCHYDVTWFWQALTDEEVKKGARKFMRDDEVEKDETRLVWDMDKAVKKSGELRVDIL